MKQEHVSSPESNAPIESQPDNIIKYVVGGSIPSTAEEWVTPGKSVDLTDQANNRQASRALVQIEGDKRPRYLVGRGRVVDIAASMRADRVVSLNTEGLYGKLNSPLVATIGGPMPGGVARVTAVMRESLGIPFDPNTEEHLPESPFDQVTKALLSLLDEPRLNAVIDGDQNLARLIGE